MSVIAHLRVPADSFELGRILELRPGTTIVLENLVPLGEKAVPFFSVSEDVRDTFVERVRDHPTVDRIREVSRHDGETLYSLDWNVSQDLFFQGLVEHEAQLLSASGTVDRWEFELRFPDHEALGGFQTYCTNARIPLEVGRVYNPVQPGSGHWYGLTEAQRDTLTRAVRGGYYAIPRQMSTKDLAEALDISDQAVTERLRRAIVALVENTLIVMEDEEMAFESVE